MLRVVTPEVENIIRESVACFYVTLRKPVEMGRLFITSHSRQYSLFPADERDNADVLDFVQTLRNSSVRTVGPELILGRLFDESGFGLIVEPLSRDIVIPPVACRHSPFNG